MENFPTPETSNFRILDLGAHDGFVSLWLARQMKERGIEVEICGLELHPHGVEKANERAAAEGFKADYRQGLAEDAPTHFFSRSFDAVIAFEVIEHVPDVDRFLDVCEQMCNGGGQVYLSTPNGCFGDGQNPHHLRVYRDIDLFNLCRRRGQVEDLHQGVDGVVVVRYSPWAIQSKDAAIYCGPGWETWHPRDITERGLGGSETAAVRLAESLTDLGYAVTIYGELEQGMYRQIELRHHGVFDQMEKRDLLVVSRSPHVFDRPHRAERAVLWMHDTDYGPGALSIERLNRMNNVMVLSEWHKDHVIETYPESSWWDKLKITGNGIHRDFFPVDKIPAFDERPHRAIYSSSPDRGLDLLLALWPKVREQVPDAELVYCYADVYNKVADVNPQIAAFRKRCQELADQPGVVNLGSLSQDRLAAAMAMCRVWLAPSYNTVHDVPFNETFCIGAVESAAAGCYRITADWGALPERHDIGKGKQMGFVPMHTDIEGSEYEREWVDEIVHGLTGVADVKPEKIARYDWTTVAEDIAGHSL